MLIVIIRTEFYFFLGFLALYGLVDVHFQVPEFPLTVCLLLFEMLQIALGPYCIKIENMPGAIVAIVSKLIPIYPPEAH